MKSRCSGVDSWPTTLVLSAGDMKYEGVLIVDDSEADRVLFGTVAREVGFGLIQYSASLEAALAVVSQAMLVVTDNGMDDDKRAGAKLVLKAHSKVGVPGNQMYIHSDGFTNLPDMEEAALRNILVSRVPGITINPKSVYQTELRNWLASKLAGE